MFPVPLQRRTVSPSPMSVSTAQATSITGEQGSTTGPFLRRMSNPSCRTISGAAGALEPRKRALLSTKVGCLLSSSSRLLRNWGKQLKRSTRHVPHNLELSGRRLLPVTNRYFPQFEIKILPKSLRKWRVPSLKSFEYHGQMAGI